MRFSHLFLAVIAICLLYACISFTISWPFDGWDRESLGQFGDSWGVVTSIFSVFAFLGVAYSVKIQAESLKQLKNDSKSNNMMMIRQQVEGNFFQMLNLLQSLINDMDIQGDGRDGVVFERNGRDVFTYFYKKFKSNRKVERRFYIEPVILNQIDYKKLKRFIGGCFDEFYKDRQQDLAHYFRVVYNIYKFIDSSNINQNDKKMLANILRAQLSNYELLMLFYNCLGKHGLKFIDIAIRYEIFDNLPIDKLVIEEHKLLIDKKAFGGQSSDW
ncbi:putative phage abortive infection protein [Serratia ureilytica]|uniref:putative phage abortive infection protein n=1 Tax=Serratia TaxID=613 RepID=UPI000B78FD63|nr:MULTISPECIES: putative phage abortive infection protein [Serratia]MBH2553802.1 putative phage abortive infection protein [Serratia ureilytica]MBH3266272.1 putative phage abortive infection protein [Serratia ureilytica]